MELRHVRYFDAIAETLNFTRAAERLHVTQSTLSHQIRQMEDELGVELFDRSARKIRMTEAGEILRTYLTPALEQIDRGMQALRGDADPITGIIRLGTTPSFNTRMVPQCVSSFLHHYPQVQVNVEELSGDMLARQVASGELDLAVSYRPDDGTGLWFEPLYNEEMRLVVASSHPLAKRRRVRMVELHHVRMVLLPQMYATRQLLDGCFEAAGAQPLVVAQLNSIWAMFELVRQTDLAGIFGETAIPQSGDLRAVPLEDPTPIRTPGMLWRKGATRSPTLKHLADIIRRAAGQPG
ncbi:MAG: LysR substrate-binding domain-containing protein [Pseudomonadota bacterium]